MYDLSFFWNSDYSLVILILVAIVAVVIPAVCICIISLTASATRGRVLGLSTDVNSGDVDDSFALSYVITRGFFVRGRLSYTLAILRWFAPLLEPYTIRIALESNGDLKLLVGQLCSQMYGTLTPTSGGFLTTNYELIELYQSGYKVVLFPQKTKLKYELVSLKGTELDADLLIIAGPTSCLFNTTGQLLYVGHLSLCGNSVGQLRGANAGELSRKCVEKAVRNGAVVSELPINFSRNVLCRLPPASPMLGSAAQLQFNPWAFSFPQEGPNAHQFAVSNRDIGAKLLAQLGLSYDSVWGRLDSGVRAEVSTLADNYPHWETNLARDRILWAVVNCGGKFPWHSHNHTSVSPPFNDLWSILNTHRMTPNQLFEFRVRNLSSFAGLTEDRVREALCHAILYDLYAVVILKHGLQADSLRESPDQLRWFTQHTQTFVDSIHY